MSGFNKDWLALREPVDRRARDASLMATAIEATEKAPSNTILDIGCGTGSTFRALSPNFSRPLRWRLLDADQLLLDEAKNLHGDEVELIRGDLNDLDALPLADVGLITASALFDLCSQDFIDRFVGRIAAAGIGLYGTLSYDGEMRWTKHHPLDEAVTASFNAHQQSDKGFGLSLGPAAWERLAKNLEEAGYHVQVAESPWQMGPEDADLQLTFIDGIVRAVYEYAQLDETEIGDWANFRRKMVDRDGSLCRVGHQDVLALR